MMVARKSDGKVLDSVPLEDGEITQTESNGELKSNSPFLYFAAITGSLSFFGDGSSMVWTSPVLPILSSNDTDINPLGYPVTSYDVSLIVGSFAFGNFIAPLFTGKLMDSIGRKNTLIIFGIIKAIFFIALALSKNMIWLLIARTVIGICWGGIFVALPVFISEIADDHNRGKFGCLMNMFLPLGQLYGYSMGSFLSIKYFTFLCAVPILLHTFLFLCFVPETPVYLLHKGRRQSCVKSLEKYRSNKSPQEIEKDILKMEYASELDRNNQGGMFWSIFTHQTSRRGFLISIVIGTLQTGTGIPVLLSFMGPIFEEAQSGISGNMTSILVGSLKVIIFFSVSYVVERVGRKPLMLFSSVFCCLPLFLLGLYFFMKEQNFGSYRSFSWLPVASILFLIFVYSFGVGPVPVATIGEFFATDIRSTAVSSLMFITLIWNTIIMTLYPILSKCIGISGCLWCFCFLCALGSVFTYFFVPETKGKSVHEIQEILKRT